ncbi:MAG: hypothetical protein IJA52_00990 [Clostridia bacterium]|nr:hypothetical protein [Clostridia bacterium]
MKKLISILLVLSMIFISTGTVFASDSQEDSPAYSLEELFADYHEYSLSEMVRFIGANKKIYSFVEYFRDAAQPSIMYPESIFFINAQRDVEFTGAEKRSDPRVYGINCNIDFFKYFYNTARVTSPTDSSMKGKILSGERGNRLMPIELNKEFVEYVCSLDRIEGNRLIVNFFMNIYNQEEVVGISWYFNGFVYPEDWDFSDYVSPPRFVNSGDCNGDDLVSGADGYLLKSILSGNDDSRIDPLTVDIACDGELNAKDSLVLKEKIVIG